MIAFKLMAIRKNGTLGSLFIDKRKKVAVGEWMTAKCVPTKGFKVRTGFHSMLTRYAPHLSQKGRVWVKVELAGKIEVHDRPATQGGRWLTSEKMRVLEIL